MLLIIGILIILIFAGLGFAAHVLFLGIIVGVIVLIADRIAGRSRS